MRLRYIATLKATTAAPKRRARCRVDAAATGQAWSLLSSIRRAVTLVEVIFSIGVILIGLLGLMSVLPLAGNRARNSVALNTGTAVADAAVDRLIAGEYLRPGRLYRADGNTSLPLTESICIDPIHVATVGTAPAATGNGYLPTVFPHFYANHNPLLDPSLPGGGSRTWPMNQLQPRLLRVGLYNAAAGRIYDMEEALRLAENPDDVPAERPKDRTLDARLRSYPAVSGGVPHGKKLPTGEYSWLATLNPHPTGGGHFGLLSVVVFRSRERGFAFPDREVANAEGNANRERLALVVEAQGFRGGAGGMVTLASSAKTASNLTSNHWIMLSRNTPSGPLHRWYRVAGTDGDAELGTAAEFGLGLFTSDPDAPLWRRRVLLDGSDWPFDPVVSSTANRTFATIAEGVVSVTERLVRIPTH